MDETGASAALAASQAHGGRSSEQRSSRRTFVRAGGSLAAMAATSGSIGAEAAASTHASPPVTHYRRAAINGVNIFYREAGQADAPVVGA